MSTHHLELHMCIHNCFTYQYVTGKYLMKRKPLLKEIIQSNLLLVTFQDVQRELEPPFLKERA